MDLPWSCSVAVLLQSAALLNATVEAAFKDGKVAGRHAATQSEFVCWNLATRMTETLKLTLKIDPIALLTSLMAHLGNY